MPYLLLALTSFFVVTVAGLTLGLPYLMELTRAALEWCRHLMLLCLPYLSILKASALWAVAGLVSGGLVYASVKAVSDGLRARSAIEKLPLLDKNLGVVLIKDDSLKAAFTHGLLRPRVYLSTGLLKGLTREEAHAVLLHEAHHRKHMDTLKFFCLSLFRNALFYLPLVGWLAERVREKSERAADDSVVKKTGNGLGLASALVKVARTSTPLPLPVSIKGSGETESRIKRLVEGEGGEPRLSVPPRRLVASSLAIAALIVLGLSLPLLASTDSCDMDHCSMHGQDVGNECETHCETQG
ncbi:MAG: M56 family metallopeptidase [Thermodesulfobacteriota bacterium]